MIQRQTPMALQGGSDGIYIDAISIIGVGNGDPTSHEPEKGNRRSLFNGLAQVILQSRRGETGKLILRAKAANLKSAEVHDRVESQSFPACSGGPLADGGNSPILTAGFFSNL